MASRGQRDMDLGVEVIKDAAELAQVQRQARKVEIESAVVAVAATAFVVANPMWP